MDSCCFRKTLALVHMALFPLVALSACRVTGSNRISPIQFDTATAWLHHNSDSTRLLVEIARSEDQHELGLSGRPSLHAESGMMFQFDSVRSGDDGFWMSGTKVPLDIAFIDQAGVIRRILRMDVCESEVYAQSCPGYFPGVEYVSALETNRGWFARKGIEVGARVIVVTR